MSAAVNRVCFVFSVFLFSHGYAQQDYLYFDRLTVAEGLSNNVVYDIVQDNRGYVWIASHGGLQKFDGNNFTTIHFPASWQGIHVYRLLPARHQQVWMITSMGIILYDPTREHFTMLDEAGADDSDVVALEEDVSGTIWLTLQSRGLLFYESAQRKFLPYTVKWPFCPYALERALTPMNMMECWFQATEGVVQFSSRIRHFRPIERTLTAENGTAIPPAAFIPGNDAGKLWYRAGVAGAQHLVEYDVATGARRQLTDLPVPMLHIFKTRNQRVLASAGEKLYYLDTRTSQWVDMLPATSRVRCFQEDRDGLIWIGTNEGIFLIRSNDQRIGYQAYAQTADVNLLPLTDSLVFIAGVSDGGVQVSIANDNLKPVSTWSPLINQLQASATPIMCSGESGKVSVLSSGRSIRQLDVKKGTLHETHLRDMRASRIQAITEDRQGAIWMLQANGDVSSWNAGATAITRWMRLDSAQCPENVNRFYFDEKYHCLWIASPSLVIKVNLRDEKIEKADWPYAITTIRDWEDDSVLVGTDRGLFVFPKANLKGAAPFKSSISLRGMHVTTLEEDRSGNLWVAVRGSGIFKIQYGSRFVFSYGDREGVTNQLFLNGRSASLGSGTLLFGAEGGVVLIHPSDFTKATNPRVRITGFQAGSESLSPDPGNEAISIPWAQRMVSFNFSSLTFLLRKSIYYSCKLEGFDDQWKVIQGQTSMQYGNLPPGTYTFRVQAKTLLHNVLSDEASITFTIEAPVWRRWYFQTGIGLVCAGVLLALYWSRIKRYRVVAQVRDSISRDLHDHIGSSLSSIGFMIQLIKLEQNRERVLTIMNKVSRTVQITQENLYDIIWNVSSHSEHMGEIIDRMREFMMNIFEAQSVHVSFHADEATRTVKLSLDKRFEFYLIFKELINNAAKYANASELAVRITCENNLVHLTYSDNGVGFDMDQQSGGHGMKNMRERTRRLGGALIINSVPGNGTRVALQFPAS